ncbi:proteasome subunit beta type-3-like [Oppia nitens]|uniref:proteasome subunit beta type-3-like n=1 Tax=Oppia nitens TaxID=1686743 RepID=UPI0023DB0549|nr:proteasome subunit beta type-3-like [Oppia nitens]
MSIMSYNGGCVIAMKGKGCVAIAADRRLGVQGHTVSTDFKKIFEMGPTLMVGLPGLATDTLTVSQRLKFRINLYELRENRRISPKTFGSVVSNLLYERRFGPYFISPVIAGLDPKTSEPYISTMDLIGCIDESDDFVLAGTAEEQAFGMCETLWEPDLEPDDLFETISQALVNAVDRDAMSGWGAIVYVIEKDKITERTVKTRMD